MFRVRNVQGVPKNCAKRKSKARAPLEIPELCCGFTEYFDSKIKKQLSENRNCALEGPIRTKPIFYILYLRITSILTTELFTVTVLTTPIGVINCEYSTVQKISINYVYVVPTAQNSCDANYDAVNTNTVMVF